jgi:HK97 family phage major capsid protein
VERLARTEPMATDTKHVPRSAGMAFAGAISKGSSYSEATGTNDEVLLTARKMGSVVRIADEDTKDTASLVNVISIKQTEWARGQAVGFDNATLGVSATENGTTIPFTSLYKSLRTTNSAVSYTADANRVATAGALTYAHITGATGVFGLVEGSGYWSEGDAVVIAHPAFKASLRSLLDSQNRPIFNEYASQTGGVVNTLLGAPIYWSLGAKVSATASSAPAGNPLMFVGNRQFLIKGDRSGPEYLLAGADTGAAFLTDEALLKMRIRRGFAVANENAFAVIEKT